MTIFICMIFLGLLLAHLFEPPKKKTYDPNYIKPDKYAWMTGGSNHYSNGGGAR